MEKKLKKSIHSLSVIIIYFLISNLSFVNAQMYWNQACSFAGNNTSYIRVQNSPTIDLTGSFTLEAWMNPSTLTGLPKGIIAKGTSLGTTLKYALRLNANGRILLATNGAQRLLSSAGNPLQANKWNHISASFNSSTNLFSIYLNGVLDTSSTVAGAAPTTNSDSLFIGISGNTTPFSGLLDEVRIWNRALSSDEVNNFMRTSLGASSGIYNGLVLSLTFQRISNVTPFTTNDFSGNNNNGIQRNVTAKDYSFQPYQTIIQNESIELDGADDYLSGKDVSMSFPQQELLFESWIFPRDNNMSEIFRKTSGLGTAFSVALSSTTMRVTINDEVDTKNITTIFKLNRWSHIAVTYEPNLPDRQIKFYLNGDSLGAESNSTGGIVSSDDSIFVGGNSGSAERFNGFIDELRITGKAANKREIELRMFRSIEASDDVEPMISNISYNFDGNAYDNGEDNGPELYFRNEGRFSHAGQIAGQPRSPLLNGESEDYHKAFYFMKSIQRIPSTGTSGISSQSIPTTLNYTINDVDVFVLLNHSNISNLMISLVKFGTNDSLVLFDGDSVNSRDNNLALLFDDEADSSLSDNSYSSFCSAIKPLNSLDAFFSGKNTTGSWRVQIRDKVTGDTGILYGVGIRFNNMTAPEFNFNLTVFAQGFYNVSANLTIEDTIFTNLRETFSPYNIAASSKDYQDSTGFLFLSYANLNYLQPYYLQVIHRNSIETWSKSPLAFDATVINYRMHLSDTSAFGNNLKQVDVSPVRYAMFGGDVNQDDIVDGTDGVLIDNDAANFNSGYLPTDLNGDEIIDGSDAVIADNNAANFVSAVLP